MPNANDNINGVFGNSAGMPLVKDGYVTQQFHNTLKGRDEENSHPANAIDWSLYDINANTVASVVKDAPNVYSTKVDKVSGKDLSTNDFTNVYKSKIDNLGAVYNKGNILGTVSQSGGVPTGAIIESGSNANGSYTKLADGSFFFHRTLPFSSYKGSQVYEFTLPVVATERPVIIPCFRQSGTIYINVKDGNLQTDITSKYAISFSSASGVNGTANITGNGRWF